MDDLKKQKLNHRAAVLLGEVLHEVGRMRELEIRMVSSAAPVEDMGRISAAIEKHQMLVDVLKEDAVRNGYEPIYPVREGS